MVVSICIGVLCVHMFICVVYTQSTCPFQLHQASVGSRPILLFIACESCVIYCDRHPVFSKMVNSQYRDWIVEKFICICVKSAESKLTTHLFLLWVILLMRRDLDRANQLYADSHVTVIFGRKWLRLQWRQPWATGCVDVTINACYFPCRYDSNMAVFVHCICPTCIWLCFR